MVKLKGYMCCTCLGCQNGRDSSRCHALGGKLAWTTLSVKIHTRRLRLILWHGRSDILVLLGTPSRLRIIIGVVCHDDGGGGERPGIC